MTVKIHGHYEKEGYGCFSFSIHPSLNSEIVYGNQMIVYDTNTKQIIQYPHWLYKEPKVKYRIVKFIKSL